MVKVATDIKHQENDALLLTGFNLLDGIVPEIKDFEGNLPVLKCHRGKINPEAYVEMTNRYMPNEHIDILSANVYITYDMGKTNTIDTVFTSGYWDKNSDYMLGDYEMYLSDCRDTLYDKKSLIIHVDNSLLWEKGKDRTSEAFFNLENATGRYFGFKVNRACATDDIIRIGAIALYNTVLSEQKLFLSRNFEENVFKPENAKFCCPFSGELSSLADSKVFNLESAVKLDAKNGADIIIKPDENIHIVTITGIFADFTVYTAEAEKDLFNCPAAGKFEETDTGLHPEICRSFLLNELSKKYIGIRFSSDATLEQISLYTYHREAYVETENVKTKDFVGIGANDLPMALMPESRQLGFRDVYWPVYCHHMTKSKPSTLRVWFQIDWIINNEEDFLSGNCNFKSDKMLAFLKYLDAYEEAGIEINFNFGWKASSNIQSWFSFPGVGTPKEKGGSGRAASAPMNIEAYAKCCAVTIKELCINRGYKCIKHLTFYNESNYGDASLTNGDFLGYVGKAKEAWEKILRCTDKELKKIGAENCVDYWLAEESGPDDTELEWMEYMTTRCADLNSMNTFHRYDRTYEDRLDYFSRIKKQCKGLPAIASEFAVYAEPTWDHSNIEYVMSLIHSGLNGGLYWILQGVMATDPTWIYLRGAERVNWWCPPYEKEYLACENIPYHDFNLFTHYIRRHSKVLETKNQKDDIRVETILSPDGEYSVFVESQKSLHDKDITINFAKDINKTFHKHVYRSDVIRDGNLTVPANEKSFDVKSTLQDDLGKDYTFIVYTTLPDFKQVKMDKVDVELPIDEGKVQLKADLIDCSGEIEWSIVFSDGEKCTIDENGVFTIGEGVLPRDKYCVKAQLKGDSLTYAVAIVEITE